MGFLIVLLLVISARAAPAGDSESPPKADQGSQGGDHGEGGSEKVGQDQNQTSQTEQPIEPTGANPPGQNTEQTQAQDTTKDDDWEKRNVNIKPREPVCTGEIRMDHKLDVKSGSLVEGKRATEYFVECIALYDIMTERGNQLAVYQITTQVLCSVQVCKVDDESDLHEERDFKTKRISKSALVTPDKEEVLKSISSLLKIQQPQKMKACVNLMLASMTGKHNDIILEIEESIKEMKKTQQPELDNNTAENKSPSQAGDGAKPSQEESGTTK